jgi:poly-gamma-glutamate capsule biosynthesis protein CapA/YwtB (metallophosphatase superfamily)
MVLGWLAPIALALPPSFESGRGALADGRVEEATQAFSRCLIEDPAATACAWELGWARWKVGDWEGCAAAWRKVAALEPGHPQVGRYLPVAEAQATALAAARAALARPATPRDPPAATVRFRAVGDVMMGTDFPAGFLPPDAGASAFSAVRSWLVDADVTFANLEGPLCDGGTTTKCGPGENCYAFRTPTAYGRHLVDAGFDLASTANNHAEDFGLTCRLETERTLDALKIGWSGRPGTVATVERNGLKIGLIAFHTNPNSHFVNDHAGAAALVGAVARTHDLVVVSFHGGAEGRNALHVKAGTEMFLGEDRGDLPAFARAVIGAGADLVLGHGPHVPRGLEVVDGRLVAYSLGNFSTYGRFNLSGDLATSLVLEATLDDEGRFVGGRILAVRQIGEGIPEPDPTGRAIALVRELTAVDFPRTGPSIAEDGTITPR